MEYKTRRVSIQLAPDGIRGMAINYPPASPKELNQNMDLVYPELKILSKVNNFCLGSSQTSINE